MRGCRQKAVLIAWLIGLTACACGIRPVSFAEADKAGEAYWLAISDDNWGAAMQFYSSEFATPEFRTTWEGFLRDKAQAAGHYNRHEIVNKHFAPRPKPSSTGDSELCFVMAYDVSYDRGGDRETLTMCPDRLDGALRIIGHEVDRGGGKRVAAGTVFQERTLKIGG